MHSLKRLLLLRSVRSSSSPLNSQLLTKPSASSSVQKFPLSTTSRKSPPSSSSATGDDEWNDAWETAWLPEDISAKSRAPWESDVTFPSADAPSTAAAAAASSSSSSEIDADTKAFVAEMDERWNERRAATKKGKPSSVEDDQKNDGKKKKKAADEYRSKKQRIHAGLWMKEIEKMEEAKLGNFTTTGDDIDHLLDSCSEIFDSTDVDMNNSKIPSISDFKSKPDGWETTTKDKDGNIWEISQREEDILLQEFERRIAFSKFQIASFIKTHIFSRRRPIDGWKYMIEELGPNARKGKGSVQRLPSLADTSTQPFREEKPAITSNFTSSRR